MNDWEIKYHKIKDLDRDALLDVIAGLLAEKAGISEEEFWQGMVDKI